MRTILVTGSDTGVGKTRVVAALVRSLAAAAAGEAAPRLQIVKVVETGRDADAVTARRLAGVVADAFTLASFPEPIAPAAAAAAAGVQVSFDDLVARTQALPSCDWRILEGAGGIATPIDATSRDWSDFARALGVDAIVVVLPDRLGAINQGRLAMARAAHAGAPAGIWLNATGDVSAQVAASNRSGLGAARIPIWAELAFGEIIPRGGLSWLDCILAGAPRLPDGRPSPVHVADAVERCRAELASRERQHRRRVLRVTARTPGQLNLADNDYLELAGDPAVVAAVAEAAHRHGTSASASPLITGWSEVHAELVEDLGAWHGFETGLLWSSGFAANSAVLGTLPQRGDLVFADRLVHASMISGLRRCGARLQRYEHLRLDRLEELLAEAAPSGRQIFVVTESVFSMDGDYPDLRRLAALKRRYGFCWVVDEAHALGWYGPAGAGLVRAADVAADVDVLVGTLGKTLASGGAYTLFQGSAFRDYLVNTAGEFIYSTALPPTNAAAAVAAIRRVGELAPDQPRWHQASRDLRTRLRAEGWSTAVGDSPIVPVPLAEPSAALDLAQALARAGILVSAVRPPTVPSGTSRLRFSLKRSLCPGDTDRILAEMASWRNRR